MEAGLRRGGVPGCEFGQATSVAGTDEEDVTCLRSDTQLVFRRLEVFATHVIAGLDPAGVAYAWHVEQDSAADQPVAEDVDCVDRRTACGCGLRRTSAEEAAVERDVAKRVDVTVTVVVVVDPDVVLRESDRSRSDVDVRQHRHVVVRGRWHVDPRLGLQGLAE